MYFREACVFIFSTFGLAPLKLSTTPGMESVKYKHCGARVFLFFLLPSSGHGIYAHSHTNSNEHTYIPMYIYIYLCVCAYFIIDCLCKWFLPTTTCRLPESGDEDEVRLVPSSTGACAKMIIPTRRWSYYNRHLNVFSGQWSSTGGSR